MEDVPGRMETKYFPVYGGVIFTGLLQALFYFVITVYYSRIQFLNRKSEDSCGWYHITNLNIQRIFNIAIYICTDIEPQIEKDQSGENSSL